MLSAAKEFLLLNCVVYSGLGFATEWCCVQRRNFHSRIVLSTVNEVSLLNGITCSESVFVVESCCLQRINVRFQNYVVGSESAFAAEIALSAANLCSLPKLCLQ